MDELTHAEMLAMTDRDLMAMGLTRQEIAALRGPKAPEPTDAQRLEEIRQRLIVLRQCRWDILADDFEYLLAIIDRQNAVVDALDALEPKP